MTCRHPDGVAANVMLCCNPRSCAQPEPPVSKTCPKCHIANDDSANFCMKCGLHLEQAVKNYDAFLSYRREGGSEAARVIKLELERLADKKIFLDVAGSYPGRFDEKLMGEIEQSRCFILLLTEGSLERCKQPGDWLAQEICHAIQMDKTIIPVMKEFEFPSSMDEYPEAMRSLPLYNAVKYDHRLLTATVQQILSMMPADPPVPPPVSQPPPPNRDLPGGRSSYRSPQAIHIVGSLAPALHSSDAASVEYDTARVAAVPVGAAQVAVVPVGARRLLGAVLLLLGVAGGGALWPLTTQICSEPTNAGPLSAGVFSFIAGPTQDGQSIQSATDAVLRSPAGDPVLELTRFYSEQVDRGAFGRHWLPLLPYAVKAGEETTPILGGSLVAPVSFTLENRVVGKHSVLKYAKGGEVAGYAGPGLEPWQRLNIQSNGGLYLTDGKENEAQFSGTSRLVALMVARARWVFHYWDDKLVALESLPRVIKLGPAGASGRQTAKVDDPLDPMTFEVNTVRSGEAEFAPTARGRWDKLYVAQDGGAASLVDRWGIRYDFSPPDKFTILRSRDLSDPPEGPTSGLVFRYDPGGRVTQVDVGRQGRVIYEYDEQGRLTDVTDLAGVRRHYQYEADLAPSRVLLPAKLHTFRLAGAAVAVVLAVGGLLLLLLGRRARP